MLRSSSVPSISSPSPEESNRSIDPVLVTSAAQERLCPSEIWYHLGSFYEDGDTYDTQIHEFGKELDRFWMQLIGPDEQLRRGIMAALASVQPAWKSVKVFADGEVCISFKDQPAQTISPPKTSK